MLAHHFNHILGGYSQTAASQANWLCSQILTVTLIIMLAIGIAVLFVSILSRLEKKAESKVQWKEQVLECTIAQNAEERRWLARHCGMDSILQNFHQEAG